MLIFFSHCTAPTDEVLESLGTFSEKEYYTSGGFQDYTDYAKYTYNDVQPEGNPHFSRITEDEAVEFGLYVDNFENWIETIRSVDPENDVVVNYDFDRSIITDDDYIYIYDASVDRSLYSKFGNYDVYFFDTETQTLYYFHNNI